MPEVGARAALRRGLERVFGLDPRSLGLLRIGLGALLLLNLAARSRVFERLYGSPGVFPEPLVHRTNPGWDALYFPYLVDGSPGWLGFLGVLSALLAAALLLGWRTRAATFGSWFLLASLNTRNPLALSYEDTVLQLLLFWGLFLPLGARFSLDARRRPGPPEAGPVVSGGSAAIQLQFAAVYFFTALHKTGAAWHADANAVYYALGQSYMARPVAELLLDQPLLIAALTRITWTWELLLPLLLLAPFARGPLRTLGVASVWAFHAGLGICLALGLFPWVMAVGASLFLPRAFWERLAVRVPALREPRDAAPPAPRGKASVLLGDALPALLIALVLLLNWSGLPGRGFLPGWARWSAGTLRLDQAWRMYAPSPQAFDYYYVIAGTLADGRRIDLARDGAALREQPPERPPWRHPVRAWSLYLDHARMNRAQVGLPLAAWHCREWNRDHAGPERLVSVEWIFGRRDMNRDDPPELNPLGSWRCAAGPRGFTRPLAPGG